MQALAITPPYPSTRGRSGTAVEDERIREFVAGEYRQVVAVVELVCGSLPTAEDAVQEALARAWEHEGKGQEILSLGAWVTTVALNLARSQMRRWKAERRARDRLVPLQRSLPDAPSARGEALAVRGALRDLPRRQREVTALRYYAGLDVAEIAEHLGISTGTVKAQLFRARQNLAAALADEPFTDDAPAQEPLFAAAPGEDGDGVGDDDGGDGRARG